MDMLFNPITINKTEVKNRIYMTAMHLNMCQDNEVSDRICAFYEERAKGGAGAIVVGFVTVDTIGGMPTNIGAHDDKFIPGLKKLADAINRHGARSVAQINHQGRYAFSMFIGGRTPVAPSPVASRLTGETPRELKAEEIPGIIEQYAHTARRCKAGGFDMVEILCGTGYLISQFLAPLTNKRTDEWGGSEENRHKFGVKVIQAIRKMNGPDYPIIVRMNGNDMMEGGMRGDELRRFAVALEAAGADAFCINVGWHDARVPQITMGVPRANYAYMARRMKEVLKVPVIASHRINDVDDAYELLADGWCDMVGMGRALIADPYLPQKVQQGCEDEILHCVGCGQGCFDHVFLLQPVECLCNPVAGHELDGPIPKAENIKNVAVVGGGVAGLWAALAASQRGHDVTLFEKEEFLGGQIVIASMPPGREEFGMLPEDLEMQLLLENVDIVLEHEVTAEELKANGFDAVIIASGAHPITPPIPGVDNPKVMQAWDFLMGLKDIGKKVVIVGGGAVGVETALAVAELGTISAETAKFLLVNNAETTEEILYLSTHGTRDVTLVEMISKVGKDIGKSTRWTMTQDLSRFGVKITTNTKVLEINDEGVVVEKKGGGVQTLPADTVILAVGSKSYNPLKEQLEGSGIEVVVVGDANKIGLAFDAIHSGYKAGRAI
jgi:2,4-dienoyl-CoA reductase (NADPH2)